MIIDANQFTDGMKLDAQVLIIGSGPAGMSLALRLSEQGVKVIVAEAGGLDPTDRSQECYEGSVIGDEYFDLKYARLRFLGGTSNHWTGWCRTFDDIDFQRSYLNPDYSWTISKKAIDPYLGDACDILDIKPKFDDENHGEIERISFNFSTPTRLGEKYRKQLEKDKNLTLLLNSNLVGVRSADERVSEVFFKNWNDGSVSVKADAYVFAMGGIENCRALKWHGQESPAAFLSNELPIGKYWMEHPHYTVGEAFVSNKIEEARFFSLSANAQIAQSVLGCGFRVEQQGANFQKRLLNDILCVAPKLGASLAHLLDKKLICGVQLRAAWEQEPIKTNQVLLDPHKRDEFGIPLTVLSWKKTEQDRATVRKSIEVFGQWLIKNNFGRLKIADWLIDKNLTWPSDDEIGGYHHMGGTRMGHSASTSVVDSNGLVHGMKNLYVAGSSIFTTSGHCNPTLPIVQFALRLADHLKENVIET